MGNLLNYKFWLNIRPGSMAEPFLKYFVFFIGLLLLLTIISLILKKKHKDLFNLIWRKLNSFFLTNFIISLFLLFFTYEAVPFLSGRFWFLLWGLGMAVWLFFIFKELVKIPKIKENIAKEKELKKYIP